MILGSKAARQHREEVRSLWQTCGELMFSLEPRLRHLGLGKEVRTPPSCRKVEGILWKSPGMEGRVMGREAVGFHSGSCKLGSRLDAVLSECPSCCGGQMGNGGARASRLWRPLGHHVVQGTWQASGAGQPAKGWSRAAGRLEMGLCVRFVFQFSPLERDEGAG